MTTKTTKQTGSAKASKKAAGNAERLRKAAIAEIGKRLEPETKTVGKATSTKDGMKAKSDATDKVRLAASATTEGRVCDDAAASAAAVTKAPKVATKAESAPAANVVAKGGKGSALDAAAMVLAGKAEPMTTKAIVETMAADGLWSSPKGKTPAATLHAAMTREIKVKGDASRFRKACRGLFASTGKAG